MHHPCIAECIQMSMNSIQVVDPFNSLQTHSTAGRPIQQPADPFNSRQTHPTAGRPIQQPADPFNSRQTHSTAGRPIQQPADPFNSRQTHSTAGRPIQRADPFNSQRRWLDPTTLRQMASPQPEGDLRDCIHVIHLTTTHSSHLLSSWRLRLVRRLLPSNPVSLSCSPRA